MPSAMPMPSSVKRFPVGPRTAAPFLRLRDASGISAVTTISPSAARSAIQSSAASGPSGNDHGLHKRISARADATIADDMNGQAMTRRRHARSLPSRGRRRHRRRFEQVTSLQIMSWPAFAGHDKILCQLANPSASGDVAANSSAAHFDRPRQGPARGRARFPRRCAQVAIFVRQ